jgi:hypothetical protein
MRGDEIANGFEGCIKKGGIMFDHEMSAETKEKLTTRLTELGIDKSAIDERLLWGYRKVSHGMTNLRLVLDDKGIDETKTREIFNAVVEKTMTKDLAKARQWHEEHKDKSREKQQVA